MIYPAPAIHIVPPPTLTITGTPVDEGFHTGLPLTFTGRAQFSPAVDTPLDVTVVWTKTTSSDLTADDRVTLTEAVMVGVSPMVFESTLSVNVLIGVEMTVGTIHSF